MTTLILKVLSYNSEEGKILVEANTDIPDINPIGTFSTDVRHMDIGSNVNVYMEHIAFSASLLVQRQLNKKLFDETDLSSQFLTIVGETFTYDTDLLNPPFDRVL